MTMPARARAGRPGRGLIPVPLVVLALGLGVFVYGTFFHAITIEPKPEPPKPKEAPAEEAKPGVPPEVLAEEELGFSPEELFGGGGAGSEEPLVIEIPPPEPEAAPPEPFIETEPQLVLEVTIGGVLRTPEGAIQRTYGSEEEAPALCPT